MANKQKILIIDDDPTITKLISSHLIKENYDTFVENDDTKALKSFDTYNPDLILLDIMLPNIDGYEICSTIRKKSDVPIIMISAKTDTMDKIMGLDIGADDYVTKPINLKELVTRIKVIFRRLGFEADISTQSTKKK